MRRSVVSEVPALSGLKVENEDVATEAASVEGHLLALWRPGGRELVFVWGVGQVDRLARAVRIPSRVAIVQLVVGDPGDPAVGDVDLVDLHVVSIASGVGHSSAVRG